MTKDEILSLIDKDYIVSTRRKIHEYPEIAFDLPRTLALVKGELESMGIPYTEKYGKSSIVAYINPDCKKFTLGMRADMDALPLQEKSGEPFSSKIDGAMHACGHDAHTAILLGAAKALKKIENQLPCRCALIFQACEEGYYTGAKLMVDDGVMDEIDAVCGIHTEGLLPVGQLGICKGTAMGASHPFIVEFFGKTSHATQPQNGVDALAMAVRFYTDLKIAYTIERNPLTDECVLAISALNAGTTPNVTPDYAQLKISMRTFDTALDEKMTKRICRLAENIAEDAGGSCKVTEHLKAAVMVNDVALSERWIESAAKIVGRENVRDVARRISSEDFSFFSQKKPGAFFRVGIRNEEKGIIPKGHCNDYRMDDSGLYLASAVFVQFALDQNEYIN